MSAVQTPTAETDGPVAFRRRLVLRFTCAAHEVMTKNYLSANKSEQPWNDIAMMAAYLLKIDTRASEEEIAQMLRISLRQAANLIELASRVVGVDGSRKEKLLTIRDQVEEAVSAYSISHAGLEEGRGDYLLQRLLTVVANATGTISSPESLKEPVHRSDLCLARIVFWHVAVKVFQYDERYVGQMLRRNKSAVRRALRRMESPSPELEECLAATYRALRIDPKKLQSIE